MVGRGGGAPPISRWLWASADSSLGHFLKARDAYVRGHLDEARFHLDRAQRGGHPEREVSRLRALIAVRLGRYAEAEPILIRLLTTSPAPDPEAGEALTRIFLETYRLEPAARVIDRWIRDAPRDGKPYLWLTEVDRRLRSDKPGVMEEHYRTALRLDPGLDKARLGLADMLLEQRRYDEAHSGVRRLCRRKPAEAIGHLGLGRVALGRGDVEEAARHLDRALTLSPGDPIALKERALVDTRLGDDEAAVRRLGEAIRADELDTEALYQRSLALGRLGRKAEAEDDARRLKRIKEDQAEVLKIREKLLDDPNNNEVRTRWRGGCSSTAGTTKGSDGSARSSRSIRDTASRTGSWPNTTARKGEPGRANYYRLMTGSGP